MGNEKECAWCGEEFTPTHGNQIYDTPECEMASRLARQKERRDPVAELIAILMNNNEVIVDFVNDGRLEPTAEELETRGFDLSLCRYLKAGPENAGKLMLDTGQYFLLTETDFANFKILKHA